jgi:2-oxoglutarate ferredoxin oxidoreductase subunit alpha
MDQQIRQWKKPAQNVNHDRIYVVEVNRDGQMHQILQLEYPSKAASLVSIAHSDGLPLSARWITNKISDMEVK